MSRGQLQRFVFWLSLVSLQAHSQHFRQTENSYLSVTGTSTLHDWTMTSKEGKCHAEIETSADGLPTKIKSLTLQVRSESLKSGHSAMDKNAYSTLNTSDFKQIVFEMTEAVVADKKVKCSGFLKVAGASKPITLDAQYKLMPNHSFLFWGTQQMKMSDFGIEPPTFMFGTVETGDVITVSFNMELAPSRK